MACSACGTSPGLSRVPCIVKVLPAPVTPYATTTVEGTLHAMNSSTCTDINHSAALLDLKCEGMLLVNRKAQLAVPGQQLCPHATVRLLNAFAAQCTTVASSCSSTHQWGGCGCEQLRLCRAAGKHTREAVQGLLVLPARHGTPSGNDRHQLGRSWMNKR